MRSTIEEGIRGELDAMNDEARGTPLFYTSPGERSPASGGRASVTQPMSASKLPIDERLGQLGRKRR
jgi:hypothetical protein